MCSNLEKEHAPAIRWSMLLSHHPPCDLDRTFRLAGVHICTRCAGMFLGAVLGAFLLGPLFHVSTVLLLPAGLLFTLPAGIDFTLHELNVKYRSTNIRRMISGVLFGISASLLIGYAFLGRPHILAVFCIMMLTMQFTIAIIFRAAGQLDSYVERYAKGLIKIKYQKPNPVLDPPQPGQ